MVRREFTSEGMQWGSYMGGWNLEMVIKQRELLVSRNSFTRICMVKALLIWLHGLKIKAQINHWS